MAFQSVPDCVEAFISFTQGGETIGNRLTFAYPGGYTQEQIDDLAENIDGIVGASWLNNIQAGVTYVNTHVRGLESIIDLEAVADTFGGVGTATGDGLPPNVTWAVKFLTGATGRSARGRMYVVGLTDTSLTGTTQVNSGVAAAWLSNITDLTDAAALDGAIHCVVSRFTAGVKRSVGVYRAVTNVTYTDLFLDSQRSRLPQH